MSLQKLYKICNIKGKKLNDLLLSHFLSHKGISFREWLGFFYPSHNESLMCTHKQCFLLLWVTFGIFLDHLKSTQSLVSQAMVPKPDRKSVV